MNMLMCPYADAPMKYKLTSLTVDYSLTTVD